MILYIDFCIIREFQDKIQPYDDESDRRYEKTTKDYYASKRQDKFL